LNLQNIDGVVILNKPTGMNSMTAVKRVQKLLGAAKAGHLGTLDPFATGVLPIALGKSTKLFESHLKAGKAYRAIFKFGVQTNTIDSQGTVLQTQDVEITSEQVEQVCKQFEGTFDQMPPEFSAKKIGGKKAYELARQGKQVQLTPKTITISKCQLVCMLEKNVFVIDVECSAGTYIRSLCVDMAQKLNTVATMVGLIRTKSGEYTLENSVTLEQIDLNCIKQQN
jgi:tRNA pseudouridine55 synthase